MSSSITLSVEGRDDTGGLLPTPAIVAGSTKEDAHTIVILAVTSTPLPVTEQLTKTLINADSQGAEFAPESTTGVTANLIPISTGTNVTLTSANPDLHVGMRVEGAPEFGVDATITSVAANNTSFTISQAPTADVPAGTTLNLISETHFTLTATILGDGNVNVTVDGNEFHPSAFEFYRGPLEVTIGAPTGLSNQSGIPLTFTTTGDVGSSTFAHDDIAPTVGTISSLNEDDPRTFTGTLNIPAEFSGDISVSIAAGAFTDVGGALNEEATTVSWSHDGIAPTPAFTGSTDVQNGHFNGQTTVKINFGEQPYNAATATELDTQGMVDLVTLTNCTIAAAQDPGNFADFNVVVTPDQTGSVELTLDSGAYTDEAGNANSEASIAWTNDTTSPAINQAPVVTHDSSALGQDDASVFRSNALTNFAYSALVTKECTHGALSLTREREGEADFDLTNRVVQPGGFPATALNGTIDLQNDDVQNGDILRLKVTSLTDLAGNVATDPTNGEFAWTYDTEAPTVESVTVYESLDTQTAIAEPKRSSSLVYNFEVAVSESSAQPAVSLMQGAADLSGGIADLAMSADKKTLTGTITLQASDLQSGDVLSLSTVAGFEDVAGNANTAVEEYSWTYDSSSEQPVLALGTYSATDQTVGLTITQNAHGAVLTNADVVLEVAGASVAGASVGALTANADNTEFTGTITVTTDLVTAANNVAHGSTVTVSLPAADLEDIAGNAYTSADPVGFTFDSKAPTQQVTVQGLTNSRTENPEVTVEVVFSEKVQSFPKGAITFSNAQGTRQNGSTLAANPNIDAATQLSAPTSEDNNLTWTFTATAPNDDAEAIYTVSIDGTSILDYHGQSASSGSASWTHDAIHPTVVSIASNKVGGEADSLRSNQTTHELTFELSEAVLGVTFRPEDVTVTKTGGDSALASPLDLEWKSIDGNTYTVDVNLAVTNNDVVTVSVAADKFQDAVGNLNLASLSYIFTYDAQTPSIASVSVANKNTGVAITSSLDPSARSKASQYTVVFTLSEKSGTYGAVSATAFSIADLDLTHVQLQSGTSLTTDDDGLTWSGTFETLINNAKCLISKKADSPFTDTAGNGSQTDDAVELVSWTRDVTRPTVTNVDYDGTDQASTSSVVNGKDTNVDPAQVTVWFEVSEPVATEFKPSDLTLLNLSFEDDEWDDTVAAATADYEAEEINPQRYKKIFNINGAGECQVKVLLDTFEDSAGMGNLYSEIISFTYDTEAPTLTLSGSADSEGTTNDTNAPLYILASEPLGSPADGFDNAAANPQPTPLEGTMFTATTGSLSNFRAHTNYPTFSTYYLDWQPASDSTVYGNVTVSLTNTGLFSDEAGNPNAVAPDPRSWTFDMLRPTISISHASSLAQLNVSDPNVALTFTSSKATSNFNPNDVTKTDSLGNNAGLFTAANFATSDNLEFTGTLALSGAADAITDYTVRIAENKFTDSAANNNAVSNTIRIRYDPVSPTMTMAAKDSGAVSIVDHGRTNQSPVTFTISTSRAPTARFVASLTGGATSPPLAAVDFAPATYSGNVVRTTFRQVKNGDGNATVGAMTFPRTMSMGAEHFKLKVLGSGAGSGNYTTWGDLRLYKEGVGYFGGDLRYSAGGTTLAIYQSTEQLEYHWTGTQWREQQNPPAGGAFYLKNADTDQVSNSATPAHVWDGSAWDADPAAGVYTIYPSDATVVRQVDEYLIPSASWTGDTAPSSDNAFWYLLGANSAIVATLEYVRTEDDHYVFELERGSTIVPATGSYTVCSATEFTYTAHLAYYAKPSSATVYKLQVAPGAFQSRSGATSTSQSFTLAYDTFAEETAPGPSIAVTGIEVTESPANTTVSYTVSGLDDRVTTFTSSLSETLRTKLDVLGELDTLLTDYKAGTSDIGSFGDLGADQSELEQAIVRFGEETMGRAQFVANGVTYTSGQEYTLRNGAHSLSWGAVSTGILNSNLFFQDTELQNAGSVVGPSEPFPLPKIQDPTGKMRISGNGKASVFSSGKYVFT